MQNCNRRYTSTGMEKSHHTRSDYFELHKIIQILFDWDDVHLHGFHIPSDDIVIDDEGGFDLWGNHYNDFDTIFDFFFKNYKWIRYIYDFGDEWRHKINIGIELDYKERYPKLVKYKGDKLHGRQRRGLELGNE